MGNTNTIIIFLGCIMAIILFGKMCILPIKLIIKLVFNSILGGALIFLINWIGASFNFHVGLNVITSIFVRNTRNTWSSIPCDFQTTFIITLKKHDISSII